MAKEHFVILGAGVVGLTNAIQLQDNFPSASITVVAKHLPGDSSIEYTSPWAGAAWLPIARDDRTRSYERFGHSKLVMIARNFPESGVVEMPVRFFMDAEGHEDLEYEKNLRMNAWFKDIVGGIRGVADEELAEGAAFGFEFDSLLMNPAVYLPWLQAELLKKGAKFERHVINHIDELYNRYPSATAIFNCAGIGAMTLGGVEDKDMYPIKGQTIQIEDPKTPIPKMYARGPITLPTPGPNSVIEYAHVYPRPLGGGVIIGGTRRDYDNSDTVDYALVDQIKRRACAICPELGKPEDLKIIKHNVGIRPARQGYARLEAEIRNKKPLIHNYGASGSGYHQSWGYAVHAVDLLCAQLRAREIHGLY